jgi:hypothetical protein
MNESDIELNTLFKAPKIYCYNDGSKVGLVLLVV